MHELSIFTRTIVCIIQVLTNVLWPKELGRSIFHIIVVSRYLICTNMESLKNNPFVNVSYLTYRSMIDTHACDNLSP